MVGKKSVCECEEKQLTPHSRVSQKGQKTYHVSPRKWEKKFLIAKGKTVLK